MSAPTVLKTSWSLLITGISASMTPKTQDPLPAGRGNEWGRGPESASFALSSALSSGASTHWTLPNATCPLPAGRALRGRWRGTKPAGSCSSEAEKSHSLRLPEGYAGRAEPETRVGGCFGLESYPGYCQNTGERGPDSRREAIRLSCPQDVLCEICVKFYGVS